MAFTIAPTRSLPFSVDMMSGDTGLTDKPFGVDMMPGGTGLTDKP